jgi:hypothetical protein
LDRSGEAEILANSAPNPQFKAMARSLAQSSHQRSQQERAYQEETLTRLAESSQVNNDLKRTQIQLNQNKINIETNPNREQILKEVKTANDILRNLRHQKASYLGELSQELTRQQRGRGNQEILTQLQITIQNIDATEQQAKANLDYYQEKLSEVEGILLPPPPTAQEWNQAFQEGFKTVQSWYLQQGISSISYQDFLNEMFIAGGSSSPQGRELARLWYNSILTYLEKTQNLSRYDALHFLEEHLQQVDASAEMNPKPGIFSGIFPKENRPVPSPQSVGVLAEPFVSPSDSPPPKEE